MVFILYIFEVAVVGAVVCEYSEFSGLISHVGEIPIALSFTETDSFLYPANACPPFVPRCFNEGNSPDIIDLESLGQLFDFSLRQDNRRSVPELKYRDVAAVIAIGPYSRFIRGKRIVLREYPNDRVIVEITRKSRSNSHQDGGVVAYSVAINDHPGRNVWSFEMSGGFRIVFDPSALDLEFPASQEGFLLQQLGGRKISMGVHGRVFIKCTSPVQEIKFFFMDGQSLSVPVRMERDRDDDGLWCPLSIRLHDRADSVVVMGRHLVRSSSQLVLDSGRNTIEFHGLKSPHDDSSRIILPHLRNRLLPLFSIPKVDISGRTLTTRRVSSEDIFGLYLASFRSFVIQEPYGLRRECWIMLRRNYNKRGHKSRGKQILGVSASDVEVVVDGDESLLFVLIPGGNLAVVLYISPDRIDICLSSDPQDKTIPPNREKPVVANQKPAADTGCFDWFCMMGWRTRSVASEV